MKNFCKLMLMPALLLGAAACSSEAPNDSEDIGTQGSQSQVFLSFQVIQASNGGRSSTDTEGDTNSTDEAETASTEESTISDIVFVAVNPDDGTVVAKSSSSTPGAANTYVVGFESSALLRYVISGSKDAKFYAFCNIDPSLITANVEEVFDLDQILTATAGEPWTDNKFWMTNSNADDLTLTIPQRSLLQNYSSESTPYDINSANPITVERVCSRFDYQSSKNPDSANENEYYIYDYTYSSSTGFTKNTSKPLASITLVDMTVINESTKAYALRRVSDDGSAGSVSVLGKETPTNYVVAWDAADKLTWANSPTANYDHKTSYTNPFADSDYMVRNLTGWTSLNDWNASAEEDKDGSWPSTGTDYRKFKYLMPNTMQLNSQMKGFSTGVVFRGQIKAAATNTVLQQSMDTGKPIFAYDNVILCGRDKMAELAATLATGNPIKTAYAAAEAQVASEGAEGNLDRIYEIYVDHGFKCIRQSPASLGSSENNYYVYYYYWNRHNDNNNNSIIGPMEFGVVRNNVYKLKVTDIEMIGHTYSTADDPDPENPADPDENGKVYLKVSVQVTPWVVRINNIKF